MRAFLMLVLTGCAAAAYACSSSSETTPVTTEPDASTESSTPPPSDAGTDAPSAKDADGPGEAGAECSFNRDCQSALRCECDQGTCECKLGPRGSGKNGIDSCDSGNDCTSAVCLEGPGGAYICSDE